MKSREFVQRVVERRRLAEPGVKSGEGGNPDGESGISVSNGNV